MYWKGSSGADHAKQIWVSTPRPPPPTLYPPLLLLNMWHMLFSSKALTNNCSILNKTCVLYINLYNILFFTVHPTNESLLTTIEKFDDSISVHLEMLRVYPLPTCTSQYKVCYVLYDCSMFIFDYYKRIYTYLISSLWPISDTF